MLAINNTRSNDLNFQIKEKTFYQFIYSLKLLDENLTPEVIELAFYSVNNDISTANVKLISKNMNDGNSDNMLVRKELYEIFLRMSLYKYWGATRDAHKIHICLEKMIN